MTPLCELAEKHGTNKSFHGYTPHYFEAFTRQWPIHWTRAGFPGPNLNRVRNVLELGIGGPGMSWGPSEHGAGLKMWREFFPRAMVWGVDCDEGLLFADERIATIKSDVRNPGLYFDVLLVGTRFDLIVDDADHEPWVQRQVLSVLWPLLARGGIYAIEDVRRPDRVLEHCPRHLEAEVMGGGDERLILLREKP